MGRCRHLTGVKHIGEVLGVFGGKVTGNLRTTAGDFVHYIRSTVNYIVEHNGDGVIHVLLSQCGPDTCAFGVHGHFNLRAVVLVESRVGRRDNATFKRSLALVARGADGIKFVTLHLGAVGGFHAPLQAEVSGQEGLGHGRLNQLHYLGSVARQSHADHGAGRLCGHKFKD